MTLISEYRSTEAALKQLQAKLQSLQNDERLTKELEFEDLIRSTMAEYGKTTRDVILMLDPSYAPKTEVKESLPRRQRTVRIYKNPHTGAEIQTKGGNHKELKAWKAEYGSDVVMSWLQPQQPQ